MVSMVHALNLSRMVCDTHTQFPGEPLRLNGGLVEKPTPRLKPVMSESTARKMSTTPPVDLRSVVLEAEEMTSPLKVELLLHWPSTGVCTPS